MSKNIETVKLHSSVAITLTRPMNLKKSNVEVDPTTKKITAVRPTWHGKKNQVDIKKGQNIVPAFILEWPIVGQYEEIGVFTVDRTGISAQTKAPTKKELLIEEAEGLGIELTGKEKVKDLEKLIAAAKEELLKDPDPDGLPPVTE